MKLCVSAAAALAVALLLTGTALAKGPRVHGHTTTLSLYERDVSPTRLARPGAGGRGDASARALPVVAAPARKGAIECLADRSIDLYPRLPLRQRP